MAEQIVAEYKLDVNQAVSGLDKLQKEYADTENAAKKAAQASNDSFLKGSEGAKRLEAELKKQPKTLAEIEEKLKNLRELLREDTKIGTEGFKKVKDEIDKTEKELKTLNSTAKKTGEEIEKVKTKTSGLGDVAKKVGGMILAAFAVDRIIAFGKEAVKLAAQSEGVERAFERIGSPQILKGLQEATRGTVSDLVLMQNAVKASNFKIPLESLASLFKFAQARARETGESVDYLVDSIILGIGRKSPLILDNLGISAVELRTRLKGVGVEAANVGDIAAIIGDIATEELAKMGNQADTTADKLARLSAAWDNLSVSVGHSLIAIGDFVLLMTEAASITSLGETQLDTYSKRALTAALALKELQLATGENVGVFTRYKVLLFGLSDAQEELIKKSRESNELRDEEYMTVARLNSLYASVDKGRQSEIRNVFFLQNAIKALQEEQKEQATSVERVKEITQLLIPLNEELAILLGKETELMKKRREELEKWEKVVKEAIDLDDMDFEKNIDQWADYQIAAYRRVQDERARMVGIELDALDQLISVRIGMIEDESEREIAIVKNTLAQRLEAIKGNSVYENELRFALKEEAERRITEIQRDAEQKRSDDSLNMWNSYASEVSNIIGSISQIQANAYAKEQQDLDRQLEQGLISREQYDRKRAELARKQAQSAKDAQLFQAIISTSQAVVAALGSIPFTPANIALSALVGAAGAAQIAAIASTPLPSFKEGGLVKEHGLLKGKSHAQGGIQIEAEGNEYFMPTQPTLKNYGLLEAMRKGIEDQYIMKHYVPRMIDESIFKGMNDIGKSAELNGLTASLKDHNIIASQDRMRQSMTYGFKFLAKELKQNNRNNRSKW